MKSTITIFSTRIFLLVTRFCILFFLAGCNKTYMTLPVKNQLEASQFDMSQTKFYAGLKLRISNEEYLQKSAVNNAGMVNSNASTVLHKLIITPKVPGKLLKINGDTLFITFDGNTDNYIPFIPKNDGSYTVAGLTEWRKKREPITRLENITWVSQIKYGGTLCAIETVWGTGIAPYSELVIAGRIRSKRIAKDKKVAQGAW